MKPWTIDSIADRLHELAGSTEDDERARTRDRILDAASAEFAAQGFRRANVGRIAEQAHVGKGTIYLHFKSKRALLVAATAREKLTLIPAVRQALARPPDERLEAWLDLTLTFAVSAPLTGRLLRGDRELRRLMEELAPDYLEDTARTRALYTELIELAADDLDEDPEVIAEVLTALVSSAAHVPASSYLLPNVSTRSFARLAAKLLARGAAAL